MALEFEAVLGAEILAATTFGTTQPFPLASILGLLVASVVRAWSEQTVFLKLLYRLTCRHFSFPRDLPREIIHNARKTILPRFHIQIAAWGGLGCRHLFFPVSKGGKNRHGIQ